MRFEIISHEDKKWQEYINKSFRHDVHHTSCLHAIEINPNDRAFLFVAINNSEFVALPLIVRPINNTPYFDATSVYGYGGPVASCDFNTLSEELIHFFMQSFIAYAAANDIVSVFSRLHSLIDQQKLFKHFGKIKNTNKTVAINLTTSVDLQKKEYRKSTKHEINQLKKKLGYRVEIINRSSANRINDFLDIYYETMYRLNASNFYFFKHDYVAHLMNNSCFDSHIIFAYKQDVMAAAALFTSTNEIMQYHLAGTKNDSVNDAPMKLIVDEARLLANRLGMKYLHLGGGVGGSDTDSLFRFKAGFSKQFYQFKVWNYIVNNEVYNTLVREKGINPDVHSDFFPLYRS